MLIKLKSLVKKYNLKSKIRGIIHIGAHECEEKKIYDNLGFRNVYWIEAIRDKVDMMKKNYPNLKIYNTLISDTDGEEVVLNIANNFQSSSILEFGTHTQKHPTVHYVSKENHLTKKMSTLIEEENFDMENLNFLNIDIQGVELKALKGMEGYLNKIDYIYTEVNVDYLYLDCCLMNEIDDYLRGFGFKRVETEMTDCGWGDAFYIKS